MSYRLYFFLLIPCVLHGVDIWHEKQEDISIKATFSTNHLVIPQPLNIELILEYPETMYPDTEAMKAHLLNNSRFQYAPFQLIEERISLPTSKNGLISQTFNYELQPLVDGKQALTFLNIPFHLKVDPNKMATQLISPIFFVDVTLPKDLPEPINYGAPLLPINSPLPLEMPGEHYRQRLNNPALLANEARENRNFARNKTFPWLRSLCVLIIIGAYFLWNKRSKLSSRQIKTTKKSTVATIQALALLEDIKSNPALIQIDLFFVTLTDAVRYHLEEQLQWPAGRQTTPEFLQYATKDTRLTKEAKEKLRLFLETSDAIKFAKYHATFAECAAFYQAALHLIKIL